MGRSSLRIFLTLGIFILLCGLGADYVARRGARAVLVNVTREQLRGVAELIAGEHPELFRSGTLAERIETLAREQSRLTGARITFITIEGTVIGESAENPEQLENHINRPEVREALAGRVGWNEKPSRTLGDSYIYVAAPAREGERILGVVRASRRSIELQPSLQALRARIWSGTLLALLAGAGLSLLFAQKLIRPARILGKAAERYAQGDFSQRAFLDSPPEYAALARTLNRMASDLERRFNELTRERNEREAILKSMREGVLAVDLDERIIMLNRAAEKLLSISAERAVGKLVQEVLRHADLQKFIGQALHDPATPPDSELLRWEGDRRLQAQAAPLHDENGRESGILVVLNDITRLHRLENLRREFVANVSHELRTPITSIMGFVETLQAGAIDDREHAGRFIEIIARQTERLNAIIEDLLALSRIEREADTDQQMVLRPCPARSLIENVAQHFGPRAAEQNIEIVLECPHDAQVRARDRLLEQAIGNLVDNALKYSPPWKPIYIKSAVQGEEVEISVTDQGPGIPAQHLPRLFERFYRVDTARSRELGGTGLGLAIVKHIVQAHHGRVAVTSTVGEGSTFTITLPLWRGEKL